MITNNYCKNKIYDMISEYMDETLHQGEQSNLLYEFFKDKGEEEGDKLKSDIFHTIMKDLLLFTQNYLDHDNTVLGNEHVFKEMVEAQIKLIGEEPHREGLVDTPKRVWKAWQHIFSGYSQNPKDVMTTFNSDAQDEIILLKDIEIYSVCEHHLMPFFGKAHIAYIPNKKIIGISKLARLVDIYARRMQIQERIGDQVTIQLMKHLEPQGAACIIEANHLCMRMRGVEKQNSVMVTSSLKGVFMQDGRAREELMRLIK